MPSPRCAASFGVIDGKFILAGGRGPGFEMLTSTIVYDVQSETWTECSSMPESACVYAQVCACECACVGACVCMCVRVCVHVCVHVCACMCVHACVCMHVCVQVCACEWACVGACVCMCVCMCVHVMCVCMHVCAPHTQTRTRTHRIFTPHQPHHTHSHTQKEGTTYLAGGKPSAACRPAKPRPHPERSGGTDLSKYCFGGLLWLLICSCSSGFAPQWHCCGVCCFRALPAAGAAPFSVLRLLRCFVLLHFCSSGALRRKSFPCRQFPPFVLGAF